MIWQLDGTIARLRDQTFWGQVDLTRPQDGVTDIQVAGAALPGEASLGVEFASAASLTPLDSYVRGRDLVACYARAGARSLVVELYWRAGRQAATSSSAASRDVAIASVDLQISVHTDRLDIDPTVSSLSRITADEIVTIAGTSACVARRAAGEMSYVEMVHPSDACGSTYEPMSEGTMALRQSLFRERLEKGVVRRARLRALWVPRQRDIELATAAFAAFAAEEADLTT